VVNLVVVQTQNYEGNQWWKWSLWIEGASQDLDRIESVTYTLHPTFPKASRTVTDRASKFQLRCEGWGVFTIPIEVRLKDGQSIDLEHELQFAFPENATDTE
jgi:transcription initiation factor IIF auxiliary subunit